MTPGILAGALAGVLALGGCAPTAPTAATSAVAPSASPVASTITLAPSPSAGAIEVDMTLLTLLPREVSGVPLTGDPETAAQIATDGTLALSAESVAVATAFGPLPSDDDVGDYVVATLVRLRPGVFDTSFFRDWRDTFDAAVCEQAGGVDLHAEADIDGQRTFIATCAGGVRTYHVHLEARETIVSMQSLGEGRFGERVVEGLTE